MNIYASKMLDMLSRVGQPQVSTTTVEPPKQKLDIGTLIAMLSMMAGNQLGGQEQPCDATHPCQLPKVCLGGKCVDPEKYSGANTDNPWGEALGAGAAMGGGATPGGTPLGSTGGSALGPIGDTGGFSGITPELLFKVLLGMGGR